MTTTKPDMNNNNLEASSKMSQQNGHQEKDLGEVFANLKDEELLRGATMQGVEERSLELCKHYIGGTWDQATLEDIEVTRIAGGLTNQLYKVALKDSVPAVPNTIYPDAEPRAVAIKYYQPKHMINYNENEAERLNDIIILTILSEVGIGPKVYGIFADGVIQEYCEHEQFRLQHQQDPKLVRKLLGLLARVAHLNVPVRKENNWMMEEMAKSFKEAYEHPEVEPLIQKLDLPLLKAHNLRVELTKFDQILKDLGAPKVFCHHDFRGSNILVSLTENQDIKLVDLEYSAYGYRGLDLATILVEWNRDKFDFQDLSLTDQKTCEQLATIYIEECEKLIPGYSKKPENSLKKIVDEAKVLMLTQFLFFCSFMMKMNESFIESVPFDRAMNLRYVENLFKAYLKAKQQLIDEGILKPEN